jgi:hypothetical protein
MDKNQGQQIVRFDFSVTTNKRIAKLPEDIERLLLILSVESIKEEHSYDTVDTLSLL